MELLALTNSECQKSYIRSKARQAKFLELTLNISKLTKIFFFLSFNLETVNTFFGGGVASNYGKPLYPS
jgi:hypothetical protein